MQGAASFGPAPEGRSPTRSRCCLRPLGPAQCNGAIDKIDQLSQQKDTLIASAQQQIQALTAPISSQIDEFCRQIDQAATSAAASVSGVVSPGKSAIAAARSQVTAFTTQLAALEKKVAAAQAELTQAFGKLRG